MNITVIGTGYVGLVSGACLAELGNNVICVDQDVGKIEALSRGVIPIHEPGLDSLVGRNTQEGRLRFVSTLTRAIDDCDAFIIAVGTPPSDDGAADTRHVMQAAEELGALIAAPACVIVKSTVPVGTGDRVRRIIDRALARRKVDVAVEYVSNPEFLKEGAAIEDFMRPDRVIVGASSPAGVQLMREMYAPITRNHERMIVMGIREAEMSKYAANAMLATRISFMNEIAQICEDLGVDIESVRMGIGSDHRIGYSFIYAGCGYGGSCFPKDVKALVHLAGVRGRSADILRAVELRNESQKRLLGRKIRARFGDDLAGRVFAIWGLAFKPGTDDMREAPSIVLIKDLIESGAMVRAYDPVANDMARKVLPSSWFERGALVVTEHQYDAVEGADALALVTEWKPFRQPDFRALKRLMRSAVIFDGRNLYDPQQMARLEFEYHGIGRPSIVPAAGEAGART